MTDPVPASDVVTIGLLLETAQNHQELADAGLRRLQNHTAGLDEVVRDAVRRIAIAEFGALADQCNETRESIKRVGRAANLRALWAGAILAFVPGVITAIALQCWIPSRAQISTLRAEQAALQQSVAQLTQSGGRVDLQHCGGGKRLCVRVDRRAPIYGEHSDYFVIEGY